MATANITKARVDRMADGDVLWDKEVRGFGVRRRRRDASYVLKYRGDRQQRFVTIGKHGAPWTPETARREAQRLLGAIRNGNDPAVKRDKLKRENSVGDVLDRYLKDHAAARNKPTTLTEATRHVETILKPEFGKLKISELTRAAIKTWHSSYSDRPYEGNRSLAYLRKALDLAVNEWELRTDNPALGVEAFPESKRTRVLTDAELRWIWMAAEAEGQPFGDIVRSLMLTVQRRGEVAGASRPEFDFKAQNWILPSERTKNGLPHLVPLSDTALRILESVPAFDDGAFLFGLGGRTGFTGYSKGKACLDARIAEQAGGPIPEWNLHDLRRTGATGMARLGVLPHVVEAVLNHISGSKAGVAGIYNLYSYEAEKRAALRLWAEHVASVVDPLKKTATRVSNRTATATGRPSAVIVPLRIAK